MRWKELFWAAVFGIVAGLVQSAEPTLRDRLQGEWSKANHPHSFVVKGDTFTEFAESKPLVPHATGKLQFLPGKEYASVTLNNGFTLWLFSAGPNVLAIETFDPTGKISGAGLITYKRGFKP